ncbi:MAG: YaaL family protein [Firmicutes bacterium]|nr:YaaL family protein [Bacillota bacterium]
MYDQFSLVEDQVVEESSADDLGTLIEQARQEWLSAMAYFDNVEDPDLVDYAVYSVEAAERKYMYLLKKAKGGPETVDG